MANDDKDQEFLDIFTEEATDLVASLSSTLKRWEDNLSDPSAITSLKRDLHTLKGSARMVGQMDVGTLAHEIETLCESLDKKIIPINHEVFAVIRLGVDRIILMIELLKNHEKPADASDLIKKFHEFLPSKKEGVLEEAISRVSDQEKVMPPTEPVPEQKVAREQEVIRIRSNLLDQLNSLSAENSMIRVGLEQYINKMGTYLSEMKQEAKRLEIQLNTLGSEIQSYIVSGQDVLPVKEQEIVQTQNYERFINLEQIGQVIRETTFDIVSILKGLTETQLNMETMVLNQGRVSTELQHRLSDTRLAPFESIVPRLGRIARQIADLLHKQVEFKVIKSEGEMDRTVLERLIPSLEHILRNSMDHGIESPEKRKQHGKPEVGKVSVSFSREGSLVIIEVADDGAGMDAAAIRQKAIEKGLLPEDAIVSVEEIFRYVMEPGFSTKEDVTQISGRGIGMDVVNTAIKELGGSLSIVSQKNVGTKIIARFPFTTSLNRILLFSQHEKTYGIMLTSVEKVVIMPSDELVKLLLVPKPVFEQNEKKYHLYYLGAFLEPHKEHIHLQKKENYPLLLISFQDFSMAIVVDNVLYTKELVVQTLGTQFKLTNDFSGATILGDGSAVFILDPYNLSMKAKAMIERKKMTYDFEVEKTQILSSKPLVMVVDDSISVRAVTKRLLERNQYQVITAKDGVDALQQLEKVTPELILLDLDMPRMDGFEFAENMRTNEKLKKIPIIVISSRASPVYQKRVEDLKLNGFLKKPYQESELLLVIESLVGG